ncbi:hypothetical protein SAMN04488518_101159 [Pseudovibrio ascidiaceicola]|uniref:Uncharacterized protein n=1 Tax=Pseudovibrio ascidiaceicola TaxID=285279 RepID=A0A1I3V112_9HYPH|nr:hypothetical protein SAMN04488518_101159 [Pseudovibrio ascidiaceicola]
MPNDGLDEKITSAREYLVNYLNIVAAGALVTGFVATFVEIVKSDATNLLSSFAAILLGISLSFISHGLGQLILWFAREDQRARIRDHELEAQARMDETIASQEDA